VPVGRGLVTMGSYPTQWQYTAIILSFLLLVIVKPNTYFLISKHKLGLSFRSPKWHVDCIHYCDPTLRQLHKSCFKITFPFTCLHKQSLPYLCSDPYFVCTCLLCHECYVSCWSNSLFIAFCWFCPLQ
jgi:hypothetical protein